MANIKLDTAFLRGGYDPSKIELLFRQVQDSLNALGSQTNAQPDGSATAAPLGPSALNVTAAGGVHDVTIQDNAPANRGMHYFLDYDTNPNFTNARTIALGPSRTARLTLGISGPVYFRGYNSYPTSAPSAPVYLGTQANPTGVNAGGAITGPTVQATTGSGTEPSVQPQGAAGFGFTSSRRPILTTIS